MTQNHNFKSLSSGLKELIAEEESQKRFDFLFTLLINEKYSELKQFFLEKADLLDSIKLKALKLYSKVILKEEIKVHDISLTEIKSFVADALANELSKIHKSQSKYKDLDFSQLYQFLPKLEMNLNLTSNPTESGYKPNFSFNLLEITSSFDSKSFKEKLSSTYKEISELQDKVSNLAKIDKETCFKVNCCDCCVYTPPLVTKLEFEYIKAHYDLENFKQNAEINQLEHQNKFGTSLEIIDLDKENKSKINPNNFVHRCPFLAQNNSCSIHEHRPFACRYFGLSTLDGQSLQACNYYIEQFQANTQNERTVFDSRSATKVLAQANRELSNDKQLVGTLSAWLTN